MSQILVLGAVNPVGCRVAEALYDRGVDVVALVDDWTQAPRLARLPVRLIEGSVTNAETLGRAMAGCEAVLHCAEYDRPAQGAGVRGALKSAWQRSALAVRRRNLAVADAVLIASARTGIRRVVYLNASPVETASERAALRRHRERGVSVTVFRPATLYGPFCPWTIDTVRTVRDKRLPAATRGPCLYVDHLVEAIVLAAQTDAGVGQVFQLHDEEPRSCDELFEAHARAAGHLSMRDRGSSNGSSPASETRDATKDAAADIQRARDVLGYDPKSTFTENMERTAAWIEWSRL